MQILMTVSLDSEGCMGDSKREICGEHPGEKAWFRNWLEGHLKRGASVILGGRTLTAMDAYGRRLQNDFPQSPWFVISRKGPSLEQSLEAVQCSQKDTPVLLLGGKGIFEEALQNNLVDRAWVTRIPQPRIGDLLLPTQVWLGYKLKESFPHDGFTLEVWERKVS